MFYSILSSFILLIGSSSSHAAPVNCTEFWRAGFPDTVPPLAPVSCTQVISPHLTSDHQLYIDDMLQGDSRVPGFSLSISKAIGKARQAFLFSGYVPSVKVILYRNPFSKDVPGDTTYASAFINHVPRGRSEACPVIIYPAALNFDQEQMKQLVVHELYHCFQRKHTTAQALLGAQFDIGLWFLEGTAQFMSDLVYPTADFEWNPTFRLYDPSKTLVNQDGYANVIFFMSWYKSSGYASGKILDFVKAMPANAAGSPESSFAAIPQSAQYFHEFAERLNAGNLVDTGGKLAPYGQQLPKATRTIVVQPEQVVDFWVQPLMTTYERINLPKRGRYKLSIDAGDSPYIRVSTKNTDDELWNPITQEIRSPCEQDISQDILVTSVNPDKQLSTVKIKINYEEETDCGCDTSAPPIDSCLFGSWLLDAESTRDFFETRFQGTANELVSIAGEYRLKFASTGDMDFILNQWKVTTNTTAVTTGKKIKMETTANGSAKAKYTDQTQNRVCANYTSGQIKFQHTIYFDTGPLVTPANPILGSSSQKSEFTYECSGDVLMYKENLGVGPGGSDIPYHFKFLRQ